MNDTLRSNWIDNLIFKYRSAFREEHYSGMWKELFNLHHRRLHEVFMNGTREQVENILRDPLSNYLHYGIENTFKGRTIRISKNASKLRQLSTALGASLIDYPERKRTLRFKLGTMWRRFIEKPDSVLSGIEKEIGRELHFPNPFPGEGGIATKRGVASDRAINAIYQASLLRGRVLEIGGGLGRTAYYAQRFGIREYTIVDLPFTGISQGYFLGRTLGEHTVRLISPDEFFSSDEAYDVALNVDSLTEMSRKAAEEYAKAIKLRAKRFISINHEDNGFTVRQLFGHGERHPYWLRPGYVEERFQL